MSKIDKSMRTHCDCQGVRREELGLTANRYRVFFGGGYGNVLKLNSTGGFTTQRIH